MERIMIFRNFLITMPSIIYHGILSMMQKFKYDEKEDIIFNSINTNNLILFVHGYHGHPCNFFPLVRNIFELDPSIKNEWNIRAISLNKFDDYKDNTVTKEAQLIEDYLENNKYDKVILIGLSKGGLVCTTVYASSKSNIQKVITIASPLMGTKSCDLFLPKILDSISGNLDYVRNDLCYYSSTSSNTLDILIEKKDAHIFHIVPKYDHMIYPSSTAMYSFVSEGNVFRCDDAFYSHIGVPYNKKIAASIVDWIKK